MNKRKNNNSPLKIAVLGHKTIPSRQGGIEIVVEELTVRMAKLGHKITVYGKKQRGTCKRSGNRRRKVPRESVESEKEVILRCAQDYHSSSSAAALECV